MDLAEPTFPVPSASTMAAPAPAGPCSGGSKSVLDGEELLLFTRISLIQCSPYYLVPVTHIVVSVQDTNMLDLLDVALQYAIVTGSFFFIHMRSERRE
jgi:hypothetical protein